ncbi:efflux transporter outer membrane subunit [Rosenbergiella collisarenosi]|uniref:efflux transporter outer membrane subunit n=1 Tax=Rosenbergiella collisarenosi TaxID=1544695 RepID=UPI001BDA7976|nr:efflux transporter outer membrane subunit [Rosenbergiella collisarenosi]MBT0722706.1 efflux transporter outer membrane subunit [Rosenbergiella collisarenosi]
MKLSYKLSTLSLLLALTGCMVGPDYQRPTQPLPLAFKEAKGWQQAQPQDTLQKGEWWQIYQDPQLDQLVSQVAISNQNVAMYAAQYRQALALTDQATANLYPTVSGDVHSTRSGSATSGQRTTSNSHSAQLSASWEVDLWGKLRRQRAEDRASAQSSQADLANATLSAQSTLAQDYFQLRIMDQRIALYQKSIDAYQGYLRIINNKYQAGSENRATVAQAQMQLQGARSTLLGITWQRAQLEHAIALLIGKTPAEFSLPAAPLTATLPTIPVMVPSHLLQRRPDIAVAERSMAAANEAIGVAIAGYFPDLTLSASGGTSASELHNLFSLPYRVWSLGPELSETLLDFGATKASVAQARAAYDAQVANYRQTVLTAMQGVEDNLVELNTLGEEISAQRDSAQAAMTSAQVTRNQYDAGMIDYLDVATTENSSLSEQQSLLQLQSQQWVSSVALIASLGGGWQAPK